MPNEECESGPPLQNDQVDWDSFRAADYYRHNYRHIRSDDRQIVEITRDFFAGHRLPDGACGVDVGSGPNLYPAMAMLPFCAGVDLWDASAANIDWPAAAPRRAPCQGQCRQGQRLRSPGRPVVGRDDVLRGLLLVRRSVRV
jgi:hypothetical protein